MSDDNKNKHDAWSMAATIILCVALVFLTIGWAPNCSDSGRIKDNLPQPMPPAKSEK